MATTVDAIARKVLYEGYLQNGYRPSAVKNRQRFNLGVLYPQSFVEGSGSVSSVCRPSGDAWYLQAECPVLGDRETRIDVSLRFLQLVERQMLGDCGGGWHEGVERDIPIGRLAFGDQSRAVTFALPVRREAAYSEVLAGPGVGQPEDDDVISGAVQSVVEEIRRGVYKVTVRVSNLSVLEPGKTSRNDALSRSLVSTHVVMRAAGGDLISVMDPGDDCRDIAAGCVNIGVFPALIGEEGRHDCMLASPAILYDYPHVATECAGDLVD